MKLSIILLVIFPLLAISKEIPAKSPVGQDVSNTKNVPKASTKSSSTLKTDSPKSAKSAQKLVKGAYVTGDFRRDICTCETCVEENDYFHCEHCYICYNQKNDQGPIVGNFDCKCEHNLSKKDYSKKYFGINCTCKNDNH